MRDHYIYPALFDYDTDGISVSFPDLRGCFSCGETDAEALRMGKDALRGWLLVSEEAGDPIPEPTSLKEVKIENPTQRCVLIEVNLAPHREAFENRAVKKTLTIPAWLNQAAERENLNFSQVLQSALKERLQLQKE